MRREVRKGQNEAWFRELNDRLEERAVAKPGQASEFEIVCECDREECTERITIAFSEYEAVRESATDFVVVYGHVDPSCEVVTLSRSEYEVVTKFGAAAVQAVSEDPRAPR